MSEEMEFNTEYDMRAKATYDDSDIQVLDGLEAVRKRPGMYIASTSEKGLHHLVWEIVDNGIDEAMAGYASTITITVDKDNVITVRDDGRGMPVGVNEKTGKSTIETIFTVLHAGGKFGGGAYKVSGGLHGVGASVVNALSEWLEVRVFHDGKIYYVRFENGGHAVKPLEVIGECDPSEHGSEVRFKADPAIFTETTVYDHDTLRDRIRQLAFLNKGIRLIFNDERAEEEKKQQEDPEPVDPEPVDPEPVDPEPVDPEPVDPEPDDPNPDDPNPDDPNPDDPNPDDPNPDDGGGGE